MKLDVSVLKYLTKDDFRVLTAVEMGMKNHEIVPIDLIAQIANLRRGGVNKLLVGLLKHKLLHHESKPYNAYRLTYLGYDFLALKTLVRRGCVFGVGRQIGVGKESDIFVVTGPVIVPSMDGEDEEGNDNDGEKNMQSNNNNKKVSAATASVSASRKGRYKPGADDYGDEDQHVEERELCLKLHRLGRTSFRAIKNKRDYHKGRKSPSYYYLSRLAATKEFEYMKALHKHGFPVPEPVGANRHAVIMSLVNGSTLQQVVKIDQPEVIYSRMMDLIVKLGQNGLIHGDFNEFNVMVSDKGDVTMIDFPQMVSMNHPNAKYYFERDVNCVRRFFEKRFNLIMETYPDFETVFNERVSTLDIIINASGCRKSAALEAADQMLLDHHDRGREEHEEGEGDNEDDEDSEDEGEDGDDDNDENNDEDNEEVADKLEKVNIHQSS